MDYFLELNDVDFTEELDEIENHYEALDDQYIDEDQYHYYDNQYEMYETQLDDLVSSSDLQSRIEDEVIIETVKDRRYINNASAVSNDTNTLTTSISDIKATSTESSDNATIITDTITKVNKPKFKKVKKKNGVIADNNVVAINESLQLKPKGSSAESIFNVFTPLTHLNKFIVSGTIQTFESVNMLVTSPITELFTSKDKLKEKMLKESYDNLIKYTLLHSVTILLREGIIVMDSFQCNFDSGSIIKGRLIEIIILFGNNTTGILKYVSTMAATNKDETCDIKPRYITAFVSILATYLRYFIKFTRDDCLYYTLVCGMDVKQKFSSFMKHTMNIIHDISIDIGYDKYFARISKQQVTEDGKVFYFKPHKPFNIVCDIKVAVDEVRKDSKKYLMGKMTANNWSPSELVDYARELEEASTLITDLTNRALSLTSDFCGFNVCSSYHNLALKHFWSQNIGPVDFVTHVKNFIISNNLLTVEDAEDMCENLLTNLRKTIVDENSDLIDIFRLGTIVSFVYLLTSSITHSKIGRILRGLNNDEEDFVIVIGHIIDLLSNDKKLILPGFNGEFMESIVWESHEEMENFRLFHTHPAGWYNIVGPALSGKTFRMMYTCHTSINWETKDIIWLDFKQVSSPQMMIAQVIYQLGLSCVDNSNLPSIFFELNTLLSSLRPGSLFVIDHLDSNPYFDSNGINYDNLFNSLLKMLVDAPNKLCYIVLSRQTFVSSVVTFRSRIDVNPFSKQTASKYIRNFTNSTISTVVSSSLLPFVHGNTISVASRGLPGLIFTIIKSFSVRSVMTLALNTSKMSSEKPTREKKNNNNNSNDITGAKHKTRNETIIINGWLMSPKGVEEDYNIASENLFREFSNDQALIVASIYWLRVNEENNILLGTECSVFTPGLVWHLCKSAFNDDILRWYISWLDLLEVGWIKSNGIMSTAGNEMGYSLSELAIKLRLTSLYSINTCTRGVTLFSQMFLYLQYFTNYYLKVNYLVEKESSLLYACYNTYYHHIKNIFIMFMNYHKLHTSAIQTSDGPFNLALPKGKLSNISQQDSVMHKLAKLIAGKLSYFLLKYNVIPAVTPKEWNYDSKIVHENILIAQAVASCIGVDDGFCYIRAQTDIAKQYRYLGMSDEAVKVISNCLKSMNFQTLDESAVSNNQDIARALTVLLLASTDMKTPVKERNRLITACKTQWDKLFNVRDNDEDYREFIRATTDIQDQVQTKQGMFSLFKSKK